MMRKTMFMAAVIVMALTGAACGGEDTTVTVTTPTGTTSPDPSEPAPDQATITATGTSVVWTPADVTIASGGKVTFTWDGSIPHNAVAADGSWSSGQAVNKDEYVKTFETAGTYVYYCEVHGTKSGSGMAGKITVV